MPYKKAFDAVLICLLSLPLCSCGNHDSVEGENNITDEAIYSSIYWSDGDSGKLGDIRFRLANIDAPETRSMKQVGGAKCELEREKGYLAKAFMVKFTENKSLIISKEYGTDRYDRLIVDIEADGESVSETAVLAGHIKKWPHKNGRKLLPKPDWCLD